MTSRIENQRAKWTKLDQARQDFNEEAQHYMRMLDEETEPMTDIESFHALRERWKTFRDLAAGLEDTTEFVQKFGEGPKWCCPHCGAEKPTLAFQLAGEKKMGKHLITYFNVFCTEEKCRKLINVAMVEFVE
jgi:hypothetical protein